MNYISEKNYYFLIIEHAWKQTDAAQLREQVSQEKISRANERITELEKTVQKYAQKGDDVTR